MATTRTIIFDFKTKGVNIADQMKQAENAADSMSNKIAGKMDTIGRSMQGLGTKITAGLTVPLIGAAVAGVKYNAQMEQYSTAFATMLGSDVKAAEYMLKLKEMAAKTPFEMTDLANSAKTLMAFGRTAEQTTGDMQMLGDISQGDAQKFGSLTNAFGKMASSGRMTGEELNMMIDAGFNPLTNMAEKSGKSMAELRKEMEGGNISFAMVQESMTQATSEGGMFFGSMEKQSKTLNGQLSTLKDTFMTALGEGVQPISDYVKDNLVPAITKLIEKFTALSPKGKSLTLILVAIGAALGPALILIGSMARGVSALMGAYSGLTGALKKFFIGQTLADGSTKRSIASTIAHKVATVASTVATKAAAIAQKLFNLAMNANPIMKIVSLVLLLIGAIVALWQNNEGFRNAVTAIWTGIWNTIVGVVDKIKAAFSTVKTAVVTAFEAAKTVISNIFKTIGAIIKIPINWIIDAINNILRGINKIKVPKWVPGIGGQSANFSMIPQLARGGVVNSATQAIIGEAGPEAVVPLNAKSIANFTAGLGLQGGGQMVTINIPQAKVAMVDLNGNMVGNILLPQITRKLKLGGALT